MIRDKRQLISYLFAEMGQIFQFRKMILKFDKELLDF